MVSKIYKFHNVPPFCQFYKKVVLRLNDHDNVIETQTIKICPPQSDLANLVPDVLYPRLVECCSGLLTWSVDNLCSLQ